MFITFCKTSGEVLHSLWPYLALTLTLNHLTNEPLQMTTMLYGLMYFTYGSTTDYKQLLKWRNRKLFHTGWT